MKVGRTSGGTGVAGVGGGSRPAAASGFAPTGSAGATQNAAPLGIATGVTGLDALLMLQEAEDPTSRRRRAVRRAGGLLDRLDSLKLALLGEGDAAPALERLAMAVREQRAQVEEPGLADVLDAVEVRALVELAKRERRVAA